jgi:molecular chaperone GrpE (heat shock protein)
VVQAGYMIGDRLLRPAMVTVARRDTAPIDTKV